MSYYVYVIGGEESPVKIGFTKNLQKRLGAIQTGNPTPVKVHYTIEFDTEKEMRYAEKRLHETLRHLRKKGEWFDLSPENARLELDYIKIMLYQLELY
jgi:predicted GIY-YIG superfamily endonuclease